MAINIQEILHPSDSDQIKWEKINYNFDQILANGGGPTGQKGSKGIQGSVGQTGAKGEKGDQGIKGETGATSSRWKVISIDQDSNGSSEYVILKPKLDGDLYHPVVFLGDQDFNEVIGEDGELQSRATLTIGKHAVGGASPSTEIVTFWHGKHSDTNNNIAITLTSDDSGNDAGLSPDGGPWTRFRLDETYGLNLNTNPTEKIEFYVGMDKFTFNTNVGFDGSESTLKLPATNIDIADVEAGMIRFYDGNFWGAKEVNGALTWVQFCMAPCGGGGTTGTISISPTGDLNVNQYGSIYGNSIEIQPAGDLDVDADGDLWGGPVTTTTTIATAPSPTTVAPTYTISFADSSLQFPAGGGNTQIGYTTGPVDGLLLSDSNVSYPGWVTIQSFLEGELDIILSANTGGTRTGEITITHPNDPGVTDTLTITQSAVVTTEAPTTQAPTTQATTTTAAPAYTSLTINPQFIDEDSFMTATVTTSNMPNGTVVDLLVIPVTADAADLLGSTSGHGSGYNYYPMQINDNTSSINIQINDDALVEGTETIKFKLEANDSAGNSTGDFGINELTVQISDNDVTEETLEIYYEENIAGAAISSGTGGGAGEVEMDEFVGLIGATGSVTRYLIPEAGYSSATISSLDSFGDNEITNTSVGTPTNGYHPFSYTWVITGSGDGSGTIALTGSATANTTSAPTGSGGGSGTGSGCNQYYVANSSSFGPVSFYCAACGCDGQSVSFSNVTAATTQQAQYTFCSSLALSELQGYVSGSGVGWVSSGSLINGACAPGSGYQGAPS